MYEEIIDSFYANRNEEQAEQMSAYMKNRFPFLGIKRPQRTALQKKFLKQVKKDRTIDWSFIFKLWELPEREFQYLAMDILIALSRELTDKDIENIEMLITGKSWWDTVDALASNIAGKVCLEYPELKESTMSKWSKSNNFWLVRTSILFPA
ncbi:MAG: DNA alkylation repair protein [Methanolobus sp.]